MNTRLWMSVALLATFNSYGQNLISSLGSKPNLETSYSIKERGANHRIWERVEYEVAPDGRKIPRLHSYTELASGLHYKGANGEWLESKEEIDLLPNGTGAAASKGQHKVIFPPDIYDGQIELNTSDGKWLRSRVMGLSYFDMATRKSVLISEVKNSTGEINGSNVVIYPDAFTDLKADVRYTYTRSGFEQDVILHTQPPAPEEFGLKSDSTRLEVLTEFFDPPQPLKTSNTRKGSNSNESEDESLNFGALTIGRGRAFLQGSPRQSRAVSKQWLKLEGRDFLIEQIPVNDLEENLRNLPAEKSALKPHGKSMRTASSQRFLPKHRLANLKNKEMKVALDAKPMKGLVLDYVAISGSATNYTFKGDTTYYISGRLNLYGTTTFEGGAVLKFNPSYNDIFLAVQGGEINCATKPYAPAIFTSRDDNTIGEAISGSTGSPTINHTDSYYLEAINVDTVVLHDLKMSYGNCEITVVNGSADLRSIQFLHTDYPIYFLNTAPATVGNILMYDVPEVAFYVDSSVTKVENLTVDHCGQLGYNAWAASLFFTNSLFANVTNWGMAFTGAFNSTNTSGSVFQTIGGGSHYLAANSPLRDAGTTNIDFVLLSGLKSKTTYPPIGYTNLTFSADKTLRPQAERDTNIPDIGYHYDPIDYIVTNVAVTNATLMLEGGVVVAATGRKGMVVQKNGVLISGGAPAQLNRLFSQCTVQESPIKASYLISLEGEWNDQRKVQFRFSEIWAPWYSFLYYLGNSAPDDEDPGLSADVIISDSEVHGSYLDIRTYNHTQLYAFKNNLFEGCRLYFEQFSGFYGYTNFEARIYNNLFRGGHFSIANDNFPSTWIIQDNLFDGITYMAAGGLFTASHNGFATGLTPFGTSNVTGIVPDYQKGPLGDYYYPTNGGASSLASLIGAGSRLADAAGLYYYTTQTNQAKEAASTVDIGYHYVALDTLNQPLDSDGDGVPDYVEDGNGNGSVDSDETDPNDRMDLGLKVWITRPKHNSMVP